MKNDSYESFCIGRILFFRFHAWMQCNANATFLLFFAANVLFLYTWRKWMYLWSTPSFGITIFSRNLVLCRFWSILLASMLILDCS